MTGIGQSAAQVRTAPSRRSRGSATPLPVIDCDVHNVTTALDPEVAQYLPTRWRTYLETIGLRNHGPGGTVPHIRASGCRVDSRPPDGRMPGSSPELARDQLLDEYGITAGILNNYGLAFATGGPPPELSIALARAYNEWARDYWLPGRFQVVRVDRGSRRTAGGCCGGDRPVQDRGRAIPAGLDGQPHRASDG